MVEEFLPNVARRNMTGDDSGVPTVVSGTLLAEAETLAEEVVLEKNFPVAAAKEVEEVDSLIEGIAGEPDNRTLLMDRLNPGIKWTMNENRFCQEMPL